MKMISKENEQTRQNRKNAERLVYPEDFRKDQVLSELRKESLSIICLAAMYAKNFAEMGFDVTRCLIDAQHNVEYLEAAYKKGVDDTIARYRDKGITLDEKKREDS